MNTFKKITLTSAVAFALFAFNACGDDSNSTSASSENSALSSAVEDDESSSSVNGDSSSSVIPGSSSSVIPSDSEGSSSSVKGSDTADGASSSSVIPDPDRESSSSSVKSSSSSAKSSSSVNSSSSNKQSSSSVGSSSSSVKRSSSSVASSSSFVKQDYTSPNLSYGVFEYEQRKYKYLTVTGKDTNNKAATINVMAENLNVGIMVDGSENQSDNSKVERYCYNNDTTKCLNYGGLYQWAEMMGFNDSCNTKSCAHLIQENHQGICPDGWRLLTYNDFYIVVHADGNDAGVKGVRSTPFGGLNYTGYSLIAAGYNWAYEFSDLNDYTYWFYPEESKNYAQEGAVAGSQGKYSTGNSRSDQYKTYGFSVRCVKVE